MNGTTGAICLGNFPYAKNTPKIISIFKTGEFSTKKSTSMKGVREGIEELVGGVADKGQSRLGGGVKYI